MAWFGSPFLKVQIFSIPKDDTIIGVQNKLNQITRKHFDFKNPMFVMDNYCLTQKLHLWLEFSKSE
jgi:hypothetical protein